MPIGPTEINFVNEEWLSEAIGIIDSRLSDGKYIQEMCYDSQNNPHWIIVICGETNQETLDLLKEEYLKAGWPYVKVITSSQNGERAGLTSISLYKNAQANNGCF